MTKEQFKELEKATPAGNKATKLERSFMDSALSRGSTVYIYSGGKYLNVKQSTPPTFNEIRFIIKPKIS